MWYWAKPRVESPRRTPYHLIQRVNKTLKEMEDNDIIESQPIGEPTPWVSNCVTVHKDNVDLRLTLDARKLNEALMPCNYPIPTVEDIRRKFNGCKVFSKIDFKCAFWQLEIEQQLRYATVFRSNGKLF